MRKTYSAKRENIDRKWYLVDAEGKILGRLATQVATILRGKHKPTYTPHVDTGDYVVVVNAKKIKVTGKKPEQKIYFRHSAYPGGARYEVYADVLEKHPERILHAAVLGMLPKGKLGRKMLKKLKVVAGAEHKFQAQKLEKLEV
ncbi:MAG: 50S ribosomal protein L13 [Candidatus Margulisbacteria bacterium]|nr:50S ribosomal protein L13 [Candidatus Margulisiibacteriota bacterium]MBU1022077.1 50S ribosomal protein L13 [Candidatus Margulisiibacteriota bacterium]MBU1729672.1 50S ribosomal protein L13 [Candidatus Margulisiibacteriota bacterium]MBU1954992.1 50S ribosomal protein L13 [Candidatus Margulisiibacteriota bacterium]